MIESSNELPNSKEHNKINKMDYNFFILHDKNLEYRLEIIANYATKSLFEVYLQ